MVDRYAMYETEHLSAAARLGIGQCRRYEKEKGASLLS
jgi:hypothetical protein